MRSNGTDQQAGNSFGLTRAGKREMQVFQHGPVVIESDSETVTGLQFSKDRHENPPFKAVPALPLGADAGDDGDSSVQIHDFKGGCYDPRARGAVEHGVDFSRDEDAVLIFNHNSDQLWIRHGSAYPAGHRGVTA